MIFCKFHKHFFFILTFIFHITFCIDQKNCKFIQINNNIFYISDTNDNFNIYQYNTTNQIGQYSESIINNKDILKLNDNRFIIIGTNQQNYYIYQIFEISTDNSFNIYGVQETSIILSSLRQIEARTIKENILFLYGILRDNKFIFYKIDVDDKNNNKQINISSDLNGFTDIDEKKNIKCDADENYYFCILSVKYDTALMSSIWKMIYFRGEFNSGGSILNVGNICEKSCYLGNIVKISDKYLTCYHHRENNILSFICQYYSFDGNNIIIGESYTIGTTTFDLSVEKPLILKLYDNSIFVINILESTNVCMGLLIESSKDFKINIKANIFNEANRAHRSIDFFNDNKYYYFFFENEAQQIILKQNTFYKCEVDNIVISNQDEEYNFYTGHNNEKIVFLLDENIQLFKGNEATFIKSNNYITLQNVNYIFKKINKVGVFQNYYVYVDNSNGFYNSFSLICPLIIVKCPDSCKSCDHNKNVSSIDHYCTECNNGFYPIYEESKDKESYNCYGADDKTIISYYNDNGIYYPCNITCKSCVNAYSCEECNEGYYFIADSNNNLNKNDICYNPKNLKESSYYLDYINSINQFAYKPCYETCLTCFSNGNKNSNNCLTCKSGFVQLNFNEKQCTRDKNDCIYMNNYWIFNDNNIECISTCENYIVLNGTNKGQCVENCHNHINPYSISSSNDLYSLICGDKKYCISYDVCNNGFFKIDFDLKTCDKLGECQVDFFNNNNNLYDPPPTQQVVINEMTLEEKINDISIRSKVIKISKNNNNYFIVDDYELSLIRDYYELLKSEESKYIDNKIYLILSTQYLNFMITIYPLDIEDYANEKIFSFNNLGFVNFTNFYPDFLNYEIEKNKIILVAILEHQTSNSSIKDLNYFLFSFDEKSNDIYNLGNLMNLKDIKNNNNPLEIQYPLYNYINNNSPVNKRNSEFLVENIKKIYENYPDVELSNLNDPFFNDICSAFTTEEGTDITLNDRRKEYYVNVSLCEVNCILIKVTNKDSNPRALCNCEIKQDITFDNQKGESQKDTNQNDNFSSFSSQNIKSFMCISESFNKNISKNVIFWIFIVVMFLQINLLIAYIKNKEMTINKILGLYDNIQAKNKNNVIISNGEDKIIYDFKKKEINTNANTYTNNNFVTDDNKIINSEYLSYPVYVSNPPKKDKGIKGQNIDEAKSDNINKQKSSLTESGSTIKDDDPQVITNISFNDINNKLQLNKIHNNNNKDTPLPDLNKNMEEINKALDNQIVTKKYCDTCEDILYSNKNKFDNKNSKKISNILDGQDIFSNHLIENYSDNGDNRRYPKTMKKIKLIILIITLLFRSKINRII